ncbi:hypothetical protein DTO271G3_5057 [Paecilomyces variotii]|nr:hypothetical protein DTO271G3_5057 [Paecilomyces variotii]
MKSLTETDADWPGSFKTVRELQEHATRVPGKKSYPNEITANAAFIALLQTITHQAPNIDAEWFRTHSRKAVSTIAEVKRRPRSNVFIQSVQEVAESVAWSVCDPPARPATLDKCHFRLILSQNESQIFITFAEFHHDYV